MSRKILAVIVAGMMVLLPLQGEVFAAAVVITAQGSVTAVSTFAAPIKKVADDTTATSIGFPAAAGMAKGDAYIDLTFNDNSMGFQAVTIATDNRNTAASPKYTGIAQGSGCVGTSTSPVGTDQTVPLLWMVSATKITGGYAFSDKPGEYFVQDMLQGTRTDNDPALGSSSCNDKNKDKTCGAGEYTDRNSNGAYNKVLWPGTEATSYRCANGSSYADACENHSSTPALVEGIDWDGDGYDGAKPYDAGYGSIVFGIAGQIATLSAAAGAANTPDREVTNGNVRVYLGIDYTGAQAQTYKTSRLMVDLVTLA